MFQRVFEREWGSRFPCVCISSSWSSLTAGSSRSRSWCHRIIDLDFVAAADVVAATPDGRRAVVPVVMTAVLPSHAIALLYFTVLG